MIEQQNATAATIATLMEAMKQLSDQVKMGSKKKDTESKNEGPSNHSTPPSRSSPPRNINNLIIADTAANGNFFMVNGPCTNLQQANPPIHVRLPDGSSIASTHTGLVPLPYIPSSACRAHIFPSIKSGSLLSIGQ